MLFANIPEDPLMARERTDHVRGFELPSSISLVFGVTISACYKVILF